MKHKTLETISAILLIVGGICWGLVGAFGFDLITTVFGGGDIMAPLVRIIDVLIGLSGLYRLYCWVGKR